MKSHARANGVCRREFVGAAGALAMGSCLCGAGHAAQRGTVRAVGAGCTELEPFPGAQVNASVKAATGAQAAPQNAATMVKESPALMPFLPTAARAALPAGAAPARAPLPSPLAQPLRAGMSASEHQQLMPQRLALQKNKLWNRDKPVLLTFLNTGPSELEKVIENAVEEWNQYIDLRLRFTNRGSQSAQVKIGFRYSGFFSMVGTDSTVDSFISQYGGQSLNIQPGVRNQDYRGVVLHELGHALGAIHEHQSPGANIPWNRPAVRDYYGRPPNNWSPDQVDFQIFQKYTQGITNTKFDLGSIMLYPIQEAWLDTSKPNHRDFIVGWNVRLSGFDIGFMQQNYGVGSVSGKEETDEGKTPPEAKPGKRGRINPGEAQPLTLGAAVDGELTRHADYQVYKLEVTKTGEYVIETIEQEPAINMVLELFSASELETPLKNKAYGGKHILNARVTATLTKGTYYVRAAHRHDAGKGQYTILFHD